MNFNYKMKIKKFLDSSKNPIIYKEDDYKTIVKLNKISGFKNDFDIILIQHYLIRDCQETLKNYQNDQEFEF